MEMVNLDDVLSIEASSSSNPWSRNMFIEEIKNPLSYCFILEIEEAKKYSVLIGFICFRNIEDESELLNICVHPRYRQMGVAKELMRFYIAFCRKREIKTFYLEVNALNHPAVHLYHLFSYQSSGMRRKFYQRTFDALLMVKNT